MSGAKAGADGGDLDAPAPPGGPTRQDAPDGKDVLMPGQVAADVAQDPGPDTERVSRPDDEVDLPSITHEDTQGEAAEEVQEENAETSLDQPSQ